MSSSNNSGEGFKILIFLGVMVFLIMYIFDLGPFKKSYTPTPTYYNNYGGGSQPSFTGTRRNCKGDHNTCDCPYTKKTLEDAHIWNCSCGHYYTWHN